MAFIAAGVLISIFIRRHYGCRSEKYNSLLTLMEEFNMVLKSRTEDVELIVFPLKRLPTDFQSEYTYPIYVCAFYWKF